MKSKVMGVDAANRRKNEASGKSKDTPRPMSPQGTFLQGGPPAHMMSGSMDKAPPSRTPKAEIKGYLSKVSRENRETEKSQYKTLDRAMGGADAKATAQDLKAAREDRMSKPSAPSKSPRPMARAKFKDGGMVKGECKGTGGMVSGKKFSGTY